MLKNLVVMAANVNKESEPVRCYRLLMWSEGASMYVFGGRTCYYSLSRGRMFVRAMYENHRIIAVLYPL